MTSSELDHIRSAIIADPVNSWAAATGYQPIYVADASASILVVGQAPGRKAQESGIPWNDASGTRLIDWLGVAEDTFRDPSQFALLPMDFYYPGKGPHGDLPPRPDFAARWHPRLISAMPHIRLTLLIGSYAQRHYLGTRDSLTATVRRYADHLPGTIPLVHPSPLNFRWLARNPWYEAEVIPVLRASVRTALG
jgi:uracil-DNA glycosylase